MYYRMNVPIQYFITRYLAVAAVALFSLLSLKATAEEVPVFITIGQSNVRHISS